MEEQSLVKRAGLAHDKRWQAISATAASRQLAARMALTIKAVYAALEAQLGAEVVARLYATLDELLAALASGESSTSTP